jgi:hypothetical protein
MAIRALIHILNEDPVLCELDAMPKPSDSFIAVRNPRKRDGKPMDMLAPGVTSIAYPWTRITFVEFFDEEVQREAVLGFFRESDRR